MKKFYSKLKICKICNSTDIKKFYFHDKILYKKCFKCGLIFQYPIPKLKTTLKYYAKDYFFKYDPKEKINLYKKRKIQYKLDRKILKNFFTDAHNKKILDYGCGNGEFINLFKKSRKYGFEINKFATKNKKVKYIRNINQSGKQTFDLIIMRGVIEHLPDFDQIVTSLAKKLKKNGIFFISATPNSNNMTMFLEKSKFNQNHREHLFHFNHVNLSLFMLNCNLYNIFTAFPYYDTPYANIKKDFIEHKKMLKNFNKKNQYKGIAPPSVGNMMTVVFKKIKNERYKK